jgi:hypothetical protein
VEQVRRKSIDYEYDYEHEHEHDQRGLISGVDTAAERQ